MGMDFKPSFASGFDSGAFIWSVLGSIMGILLSLLCCRFRELRDTCCHAHAPFIAALYSPRRTARLHLAQANENANAQGSGDLNLTFMVFKRAEASSAD
jgi:hypothetical protein